MSKGGVEQSMPLFFLEILRFDSMKDLYMMLVTGLIICLVAYFKADPRKQE